MKTILVAGSLVALLSLCGGCAGMQFEISRSTVQKKVEKKFPIHKSVLVAKVELTNPNVYFADKEIGITLDFKGNVLTKKINGTADVRGTLVYKPKKKKFYIEELKLIELETADKKISSFGKLQSIVNSVIKKKLDGLMVYTLNPEKRKERFARAYMEKVEVSEDKDSLIVTLGHRQESVDATQE